MDNSDDKTKERFMSKVVIDEETKCWNWKGATSVGGQRSSNKNPYGSFRLDTRTVWRAHRYAHIVLGEVEHQKGLHIHHTCNNTLCVNPEHLSYVEPKEHRVIHGQVRDLEDQLQEGCSDDG